MSWLSKWWRSLTESTSPPKPPVIVPLTIPAPVSTGSASEQLVALVNAARSHRGVAPLTLVAGMLADAQQYAETMDRDGVLRHRNPLPAGVWGEIIAQGQRSPAEVFRSWQTSPGHHRIMMDPSYRSCGFGHSGEFWCGTFR